MFGGIGSILCADAETVDLVKHNAELPLRRVAPPPIVAAASTILDIFGDEGRRWSRATSYFRGELVKAGFDLGHSSTHHAVMTRGGGDSSCVFARVRLLMVITYPGVKQGGAAPREHHAGHTREDMDTASSC